MNILSLATSNFCHCLFFSNYGLWLIIFLSLLGGMVNLTLSRAIKTFKFVITHGIRLFHFPIFLNSVYNLILNPSTFFHRNLKSILVFTLYVSITTPKAMYFILAELHWIFLLTSYLMVWMSELGVLTLKLYLLIFLKKILSWILNIYSKS